jgi:SagB-type dehydrogenase family enzyme
MNRSAQQINYVQEQLARETTSVASLFHEQSKARPNMMFSSPASVKPDFLPDFSRHAFKEYRFAPRTILPEAQSLPISLDRLILKRRSIRTFANQAVTLEKLATQLALSYRIIETEIPKRPVPSGGALYPLELYMAALNVNDIDQGLYHYHPAHHALELLSDKPPRPALEYTLLPDTLPVGAAYVFCICGVLPRNRFKYGELGYRLMLLEAGHLAQNILLVAEAQGLGGLPLCGFYDDRMHDYLVVDGIDEVCLYLLIIGHPASS